MPEALLGWAAAERVGAQVESVVPCWEAGVAEVELVELHSAPGVAVEGEGKGQGQEEGQHA